jgi:hypothetical protein
VLQGGSATDDALALHSCCKEVLCSLSTCQLHCFTAATTSTSAVLWLAAVCFTAAAAAAAAAKGKLTLLVLQ